jgi:hypothetical protein
MFQYKHHVFGFFVKREEAEIAQAKIVRQGLRFEQMQIHARDRFAPIPALHANSNVVLKDLLVGAVWGTGIGAIFGALGEWALLAANIAFFTASPLIAPLAMLGWGASLGAVIGAVAGAINKKPEHNLLTDWVRDALLKGQVVLTATTFSEAETRTVSDALQLATGSYKDVPARSAA